MGELLRHTLFYAKDILNNSSTGDKHFCFFDKLIGLEKAIGDERMWNRDEKHKNIHFDLKTTFDIFPPPQLFYRMQKEIFYWHERDDETIIVFRFDEIIKGNFLSIGIKMKNKLLQVNFCGLLIFFQRVSFTGVRILKI